MAGGARAVSERIETLDGLRGLAALTVVFHHTLAALPEMWAVYEGGTLSWAAMMLGYGPLHLLWGGGEAVIVFFVLSGFVLSLPFWSEKPVPYASFALRRMFRLYPTYAVAMAAGFAAVAALSPRGLEGMSAWFNAYWTRPASAGDVADHLLVLSGASHNFINPVIWTLTVEIQISLAFPLLIFYMRSMGWLSVPSALALSFAAAQLLGTALASNDFARALLLTAANGWLFVLGAEIGRHRARLRHRAEQLSQPVRWVLVLGALMLINIRWQGGGATLTSGLLVPAGGAILIAACAWFGELRPFLASAPIKWLGKISYSLYLIHLIVLFALVYGLGNPPLALALVVPVSLLTAAALHAAVERPFIGFGQSLSAPDRLGHA